MFVPCQTEYAKEQGAITAYEWVVVSIASFHHTAIPPLIKLFKKAHRGTARISRHPYALYYFLLAYFSPQSIFTTESLGNILGYNSAVGLLFYLRLLLCKFIIPHFSLFVKSEFAACFCIRKRCERQQNKIFLF